MNAPPGETATASILLGQRVLFPTRQVGLAKHSSSFDFPHWIAFGSNGWLVVRDLNRKASSHGGKRLEVSGPGSGGNVAIEVLTSSS